jgi:hypothetical protein
MSRPFAKTFARKFAPRPSRAGSGATIDGRPAWQVIAERATEKKTEPK